MTQRTSFSGAASISNVNTSTSHCGPNPLPTAIHLPIQLHPIRSNLGSRAECTRDQRICAGRSPVGTSVRIDVLERRLVRRIQKRDVPAYGRYLLTRASIPRLLEGQNAILEQGVLSNMGVRLRTSCPSTRLY